MLAHGFQTELCHLLVHEMREEPVELFIQNACSLRSASLLLLPPLLLLLLPPLLLLLLLLLLLVGGGGCGVVGSNLSVSSVQLH